ncbi:glycine cleavage system protein GcvH [Xylophilus rhododendri]|uniref:Glycine cleavage system H protein n=1 Tax=Xylophilus rhododendri TaxID=2697032 RepID=A0A857J618_9BURK|nr:glycine cleavage system protein GcvH [Xylophilus rhododendri]QHI98441.1 glycine cleavage system protein GcvH [Xylophilus rhododendri]
MTVKFSREHQWIDSSDTSAARVGITPFAQDTLGDIVFVDLPAVGKRFAQGEVAAVVESVKTAADVFMPAAGEIVAINEALRDDPALANTDPLGAAWFFTVKLSDPAELDGLLDAAAYEAFSKDA